MPATLAGSEIFIFRDYVKERENPVEIMDPEAAVQELHDATLKFDDNLRAEADKRQAKSDADMKALKQQLDALRASGK